MADNEQASARQVLGKALLDSWKTIAGYRPIVHAEGGVLNTPQKKWWLARLEDKMMTVGELVEDDSAPVEEIRKAILSTLSADEELRQEVEKYRGKFVMRKTGENGRGATAGAHGQAIASEKDESVWL
jgi:hypothetical protein